MTLAPKYTEADVQPITSIKPLVLTVKGNIDQIIQSYDWNASIMEEIIKKESAYNLNAKNLNDNHGSCWGSFGLAQLSCELVKGKDWTDASTSISIAYSMYVNRGKSFRDWSTCRVVKGCT